MKETVLNLKEKSSPGPHWFSFSFQIACKY